MECTYCGGVFAKYQVSAVIDVNGEQHEHPLGMRCQGCTINCLVYDFANMEFLQYIVKPL